MSSVNIVDRQRGTPMTRAGALVADSRRQAVRNTTNNVSAPGTDPRYRGCGKTKPRRGDGWRKVEGEALPARWFDDRDEKLRDRTLNHFLFQATKNEHGEWVDGERWANCGRIRISASPEAQVAAKLTPEGVGSISGYQMCGSIWVCPQCAAKIRKVRAEQISKAIRVWLAMGGRVYFITPTMWHHKGMRLKETLETVLGAWRSAFQGRSRKRLEALGYGGFIRAVDLTIGDDNGYHPHLHNLLFVHSQRTYDLERADLAAKDAMKWARQWEAWDERNSDPFALVGALLEPEPVRPEQPERRSMAVVEAMDDDELLAAIDGYFRTELNRYLKRSGHYEMAPEGLKVDQIKDEEGIGMYVSKAGFELARSDKKDSPDGGLTPWQLLHEAYETGEVHRLGQWREYCETTKGRRAIEWSHNGLKRRLLAIEDDDPDDTDEAIVKREVVAETVALFGPKLARLIGMQVAVRIAVTRAMERNRADGIRYCLQYELKKRVLASVVSDRPHGDNHDPPQEWLLIEIAEG